VWGYDTPYESVRYSRSPAYYREYVSPYRHEEIDVPSVETETVVRRPVVVYPAYPPAVVYPEPVVVAPRRFYTPRYYR
jgi:hypothetical protein